MPKVTEIMIFLRFEHMHHGDNQSRSKGQEEILLLYAKVYGQSLN